MILKIDHITDISEALRKTVLLKNKSTQKVIVILDEILDSKFPKLVPSFKEDLYTVIKISQAKPVKSLSTFSHLVEEVLSHGISKDSILVGIGGGSVTDLVGFTASVLLRGINWVSIPSTYLGMIDASIGGKTGLDTSYGKNLIGSFHRPMSTLICSDFLDTLDPIELESGHGELVKYALLSKDIAERVENKAPFSETILACAKYKSEIVDKDFTDLKERRFLNLGHTLGHAFEVHFRIPHGKAIFWGLYWEHSIMGYGKVAAKILELGGILDFPVNSKVNILELDLFWKYVVQDKKIAGNQVLELPLVDENANQIKVEITLDDFYNKLNQYKKNLHT
jgi:3-dehydroquinate synthase